MVKSFILYESSVNLLSSSCKFCRDSHYLKVEVQLVCPYKLDVEVENNVTKITNVAVINGCFIYVCYIEDY